MCPAAALGRRPLATTAMETSREVPSGRVPVFGQKLDITLAHVTRQRPGPGLASGEEPGVRHPRLGLVEQSAVQFCTIRPKPISSSAYVYTPRRLSPPGHSMRGGIFNGLGRRRKLASPLQSAPVGIAPLGSIETGNMGRAGAALGA